MLGQLDHFPTPNLVTGTTEISPTVDEIMNCIVSYRSVCKVCCIGLDPIRNLACATVRPASWAAAGPYKLTLMVPYWYIPVLGRHVQKSAAD
jgi:hypothetical protein